MIELADTVVRSVLHAPLNYLAVRSGTDISSWRKAESAYVEVPVHDVLEVVELLDVDEERGHEVYLSHELRVLRELLIPAREHVRLAEGA